MTIHFLQHSAMSAAATIDNAGPGDGRVNKRIENYTAFWQKDTKNEEKVDTDNRVDNYTEVINGKLY